MPKDESNQEDQEDEDNFEDLGDEPANSNGSKGDDSEDAEALSPEALQEYNKRVGKNYKSWDDVGKREKEADIAFAQGKGKVEKKPAPKPKTSSIDTEVVEELLLTKHPEAEHVMDDLRETAELKGVSILKLFRESKYFQGEAKALADAKKVEEEAKDQISNPSSGTGGGKGNKIAFSKVDLNNPEHVKWINSDPKIRASYNDWRVKN